MIKLYIIYKLFFLQLLSYNILTLSGWIVVLTPSFVKPALANKSNSFTKAVHVAFAMFPDNLFISTGS